MLAFSIRCGTVVLLAAAILSLGTAQAVDLNPAALAFKLPDKIQWKDDVYGAQSYLITGDPTKPGFYAMLFKWSPHNMSHPHYHPHDRFITVVKGTWWVGTGDKYKPEATVPMPAGSVVTHFGQQIHYDGAKDGEVILEIVGEGPATAIPAEKP